MDEDVEARVAARQRRTLLAAEEVCVRQEALEVVTIRALADDRDADARKVGDLLEAVQFLLRRESTHVTHDHLAVGRESFTQGEHLGVGLERGVELRRVDPATPQGNARYAVFCQLGSGCAARRERQIRQRVEVTHPAPRRAVREVAQHATVLGDVARHVRLVDRHTRDREVACSGERAGAEPERRGGVNDIRCELQQDLLELLRRQAHAERADGDARHRLHGEPEIVRRRRAGAHDEHLVATLSSEAVEHPADTRGDAVEGGKERLGHDGDAHMLMTAL